MVRPRVLLVLVIAVGVPIRSEALGPNAGGVLVLHSSGGIIQTNGESYCGTSGLTECNQARTRVDGDSLWILHALAASPEASHPSVSGVLFGIRYDPGELGLAQLGRCGDDEYDWPGWPGTEGRVTVSWNVPQTDHLFEVYDFVAYTEPGVPTVFSLGPHPTEGGYFLGGGDYWELDEIADYGRLGFGTNGYLPCPEPEPTPVRQESWGMIKMTYRDATR
jgi:hypothetical protein